MKKEPTPNGSPMHAAASSWLSSPGHKHWLLAEAQKLVDFFKDAVLDPAGGFFELDGDGRPFNRYETLPCHHLPLDAHLRPGAPVRPPGRRASG